MDLIIFLFPLLFILWKTTDFRRPDLIVFFIYIIVTFSRLVFLYKNPEYYINKSAEDITSRLEETKLFMSEGNYLIDGLVLSYNDLKLHDELGETAHHPRYKMAFKFLGDTKVTQINSISWQVSRNGYLTPVANIETVELSGANVSRVTLHNYGIVKQNNLKIGDKIEIVRSGEVSK